MVKINRKSVVNYPKVSILIPTYNRPEFLSLCLDSALAQDYPDLEVIVSDNASEQSTYDAMQKYLADPRVKYYRNDENIGIFPNWEKLLYEYATGEYGKILCDDDRLADQEHIKKAVDLMRRENLEIVLSGSLLEKEEQNRNSENLLYDPAIPAVTDVDWWLKNSGRKFGPHNLLLNFCNGAVFSIKKARELKIFIPYVYGGDYEALFRFMLSGSIGYLPGNHFIGRYHPSNDGSLGSFNRAAESLAIFRRIYDFGLARGIDPVKLTRFNRRNLIVFINVFLVPKWFREKGISLNSIFGFKKFLNRIDRAIFPKVIISYPTLCWLLRLKNEKLYNQARAIIRKYR